MSKQFKVGDRVRLTRNNNNSIDIHPNIYTIYTVKEISLSYDETRVVFICIQSHDIEYGTSSLWWHSDRFELYIQPVTLPDELFEL